MGQYPKVALTVTRNPVDVVGRQPVLHHVRRKTALMVMSYACQLGTDPNITLGGAEQRAKTVALNARSIAFVVRDKPGTIEANESVECCEPKVSVGRLADCSDYVLRQSIIRGP